MEVPGSEEMTDLPLKDRDGSAQPVRPGQLTVRNLEKSFVSRQEAVHVIKDVSFTIEPGQFFTLLGPSGCGKTTTLRCIAGLERADRGYIAVGGRVLANSETREFVAASERDFGMVFQSYAIWPHMTVARTWPSRSTPINVATSFHARRSPPGSRRRSPWSGWTSTAAVSPRSCPAVSNSGWRSRAR